jgi:hypothetical protein
LFTLFQAIARSRGRQSESGTSLPAEAEVLMLCMF